MLLRSTVPLVVLILMAVGCALDSRSITAPSDAIIEVAFAEPLIAVNSTMNVTVRVQRLDASPVEDGTEIQLAVTAGSLDQENVRTTNGVATVSYQAGPVPGDVRLSAQSGGASVEVPVTVVSGPETDVSDEARPSVLPPGGGEGDSDATVIGPDGESAAVVPAPFEIAEGGATVSTPVSEPIGAEALIGVQAALNVKISASAERITPGDAVDFTVEATGKGGKRAAGRLSMDFGDGRGTTMGDFRNRATLTRVYRSTGRYRVVADLAADDGLTAKAYLIVLVKTKPVLSMKLSASPSQPTAGDVVAFSIEAARVDGKRTAGRLSMDFGDGRSMTMGDFLARAILKRTYPDAGTYTVTAQLVSDDDTTATAELVLTVKVPILSVTMSASPSNPVAGGAVSFTVAATSSDGKVVVGKLTMDYGDGSTKKVAFRLSETTSRVYSQAGTYPVSASLAHSDGRVGEASLVVTVAAGGGGAGDQLDLSQVIWLHTNVSRWSKTSTVTSVSIGNPPVCIHHTKSGQWPVIQNSVAVEGNPWIFAKVNGQWYAATYEWNRPGQTCKGSIEAGTLGEHIKKAPLDHWKPKSGEQVGFMVSTPARFGPQGPVNERSNVVLVNWP